MFSVYFYKITAGIHCSPFVRHNFLATFHHMYKCGYNIVVQAGFSTLCATMNAVSMRVIVSTTYSLLAISGDASSVGSSTTTSTTASTTAFTMISTPLSTLSFPTFDVYPHGFHIYYHGRHSCDHFWVYFLNSVCHGYGEVIREGCNGIYCRNWWWYFSGRYAKLCVCNCICG